MAVLSVSVPCNTQGSFSPDLLYSWDIPGHQTDCLVLSLHLMVPWCPVWILANIFFLRGGGITIRDPRISMPFYKISTLHHCYNMHMNITLHLAFLNWLFPFTM